MKKALFVVIAVLSLTFALEEFSGAKDKTSIAVLPFNVHSAENIDYVRSGIWDMLSSRISVADKIEVAAKDAVLDVLKTPSGKELSLADAYGFGKKMNVDFIVWGSITKIGNSLSIDGKLVDIKTNKAVVTAFVQSQGMDEVIPKINDFAQRIDSYILGSVPSASSAVPSPDGVKAQAPSVSRESEIIAGMKSRRRGTFTSAPINADFINSSEPIDRKGFWMSQKFATTFRGMDVGDVNGDGVNEVVTIDSYNVMVYQYPQKGGDLVLLQTIHGNLSDNYLSLDVADINGNGIREIIVTSIHRDYLNSFVLEFKEGKFVQIAANMPWFLRVITDSAGMVLLLGQERGTDTVFNTPIHEIIWNNGIYKAGSRMSIPEGLSVYGLTLDTLGPGTSEKVIALDDSDYLNVYDKTTKPLSKLDIFGGSKEKLWKSDDVFGGSNVFIMSGSGSPEDSLDRLSFIGLRILTNDLNKDGKNEIIIVKNLSASGRILKNTRMFTASEIYSLEWDGLGMLENWKTRKINGYVADYQFKDIDNDGKKEIVIALVLSVGMSLQERSVVIFYRMIQ
ncbi:MAG: VCBS repeat-containing protein [Deltaproteobacteria bacterium]|nr:VCBS repeat-containing protein [Deltaproteobacteria bacterium]